MLARLLRQAAEPRMAIDGHGIPSTEARALRECGVADGSRRLMARRRGRAVGVIGALLMLAVGERAAWARDGLAMPESPGVPVAQASTPPGSEAAVGAAAESRPLGARAARSAGESSPEQGDVAGDASDTGPEVMRVAGALVTVVGLLLGVRLVLGRMGIGARATMNPNQTIEIVARYPVSRGQQLLLVRLASRVVLVHHSGTSMTALSEVADPHEVKALLSQVEESNRGRAGQRAATALGSLWWGRAVTKPRPGDATVASPWAPVEVVDLTRDPGRESR